MSKRIKWCLVIITPLLCSLPAHRATAQSGSLDVKTSIEIALTNNRSLRADSLNISITGSKNKEIAGMYLPQANLSSGTEYNPAISSQLLPGSIVGQPSKEYVPVKFGTRYSMKSGIEVTQTIYRKDLRLQIKEAGLQTNIAKTRYTLSKEELVYQVASAFYTLQTNAEMIRNTRFDYLNMKGVMEIAKAQYENGVLKKIDYESLQINVANTLSQLNQLQTQYNDQLAYFNYLLGIPADSQTIISDNISRDLHEAGEANGLSQRADIRLSHQLIESKQSEINRIQAEKLPVVSSYFRFNYQSQFDNPGKAFNNDNMFRSSTVGISVSVPLFDGYRRKNRTEGAQIQLQQLKLQSSHQQEEARMQFISASGRLANYREQYTITKQNLELASNLFSSRKALYTEGVTTLIELLDAERELSNSRNLHMQALIDVQTGWLDLHKAKGTLLTDFIKSI